VNDTVPNLKVYEAQSLVPVNKESEMSKRNAQNITYGFFLVFFRQVEVTQVNPSPKKNAQSFVQSNLIFKKILLIKRDETLCSAGKILLRR
jgi:hypothetical protein